jgi:hypothetical protein
MTMRPSIRVLGLIPLFLAAVALAAQADEPQKEQKEKSIPPAKQSQHPAGHPPSHPAPQTAPAHPQTAPTPGHPNPAPVHQGPTAVPKQRPPERTAHAPEHGARPGDHAERSDHGHFDHGRHVDFRERRDLAHFTPHERLLWRGGAWHHEVYNGQFGWWWVADGGWYFYPEPHYPYPIYVAEVVEFEPAPVVVVPPVVVAQPPPVAVVPPVPAPPPIGPAPAQFWYFCQDSNAYYPYVASCQSGWRQVPATPQ